MSEINKTTFLVQHKSSDCKWGLNEGVCKSKKKWMNGSVSVKSQVTGVLVKSVKFGILVGAIVSVINHAKLISFRH